VASLGEMTCGGVRIAAPSILLKGSDRRGEIYVDIAGYQRARVAELADALDSGFHFHRFQRAASRFNKSDKTLDSIG
jgi:hypothetical protein